MNTQCSSYNCHEDTAVQYSSTLSLTSALDGVGVQRCATAYPWERDPVPIAQDARLNPSPIGKGAENFALPKFDPGFIQPVASRYTDYAITAHAYKHTAIDTLDTKINVTNLRLVICTIAVMVKYAQQTHGRQCSPPCCHVMLSTLHGLKWHRMGR
jgi:hypothetical protein